MPIEILKLPVASGAPQALAMALLPDQEQEPGTIADLSNTLVVLPGNHAIERFHRRLVERAAELDVCLLPPDCCTPGGLVKRAIPERRPFASSMAVRQAWRRAVEELGSPWASQATTSADRPISEGLLDHLIQLSSDCSGALLSFADIVGKAPTLGEHFEFDLWQRLARLQERMIGLLLESGLDEPSIRALEVLRSESPKLLWGNTQRIVAVLADPMPAQRQVLRLAARFGLQVQVANHAEAATVPNAIDSEGFPSTTVWRECPIEIDSNRIQVVDGPSEVAAAVADLMQGDHPVVCLPDSKFLGGLTSKLGGERKVRAPGQRPFTHSRMGTLVQSLRVLCTEWSMEALSAFVRHPDVEAWLLRQPRVTQPVRALTAYRIDCPGAAVDEPPSPHAATEHEAVEPILKAVSELLHTLRIETLGVARWSDALAHAIRTLVGDNAAGQSAIERLESVQLLLRELAILRDLPVALAPAGTMARFQILSHALEAQTVPPAPEEASIDCLGWLECGMHDGGRLVFAGMNEGSLPAKSVNDPWLPDGVRQRLGMPTAAGQYGRDSWILHSLLTAQNADLWFVVARNNAKSHPLQPSRLLFRPSPTLEATPGNPLARRVMQLTGKTTNQLPRPSRPPAPGVAFARQPLAVGTGEFKHISVTQFKDWLVSPRLFQFKHDPRLKLGIRNDVDVGLNSAAFGSLAHEVLRRFGAAQMKDGHASTDSTVWAAMRLALDEVFIDLFTSAQRQALRPELESLEARLRRLAPEQAARVRDGWQIRHVELELKAQAPGVTPHQLYKELLGRIDRVDFHPELGWLALDYKTRRTAEDAADSHRKPDGTWTDLQLPLYRYLLLQSSGYQGNIRVGLVNLPEESGDPGFSVANWSVSDFDSAMYTSAGIVQRIIAGDFTEQEPPSEHLYDFAALWGQTLRGGEDES